MKLAISAVLLTLAIGTPAHAFQEPDKDKEKPQQEEPKKQEPERQQPPEKEKQPQEKPQEKQPPRDNQKQDKEQADRARQTDKAQQQNEKQQQQTVKQEQQTEKDRAKQDHATQEQQRDAHNNVQPAQRDAGNRNARRIPDQDFRTHFGREHAFRVARRDDRRFNYGGYWFVYSQPWPGDWSYDDDVYVDDIDGEYYLIDPVHPGIRLLLIVSS
jgi:outer membrane biosynthesis protein TonB